MAKLSGKQKILFDQIYNVISLETRMSDADFQKILKEYKSSFGVGEDVPLEDGHGNSLLLLAQNLNKTDILDIIQPDWRNNLAIAASAPQPSAPRESVINAPVAPEEQHPHDYNQSPPLYSAASSVSSSSSTTTSSPVKPTPQSDDLTAAQKREDLFKAVIKYGDSRLDEIRKLLEDGAPVNTLGVYKPRHLTGFARGYWYNYSKNEEYVFLAAIKGGHFKTAKLLLEYKANPNIANPEDGNNALHIIMTNGSDDALKFLFSQKILLDPGMLSAKNKADKTPFDLAVDNFAKRLLKSLYTSDPFNASPYKLAFEVVYQLITVHRLGNLNDVLKKVNSKIAEQYSMNPDRLEQSYMNSKIGQALAIIEDQTLINDGKFLTKNLEAQPKPLLSSEQLLDYILKVNNSKEVDKHIGLIANMLNIVDNAPYYINEAIHQTVKNSNHPGLKKLFADFYSAQMVKNSARMADLDPSSPTEAKYPKISSPSNNNAASTQQVLQPSKPTEPVEETMEQLLTKIVPSPSIVAKAKGVEEEKPKDGNKNQGPSHA